MRCRQGRRRGLEGQDVRRPERRPRATFLAGECLKDQTEELAQDRPPFRISNIPVRRSETFYVKFEVHIYPLRFNDLKHVL